MNRQRAEGIGLSLVWLVVALSACGVAGRSREPIELTIVHTGLVIGETSPCG